MNWKSDLKLSDLDGREKIEVTCKRCGASRYESAAELMSRGELKQAYLDEIERSLKCTKRPCRGDVRIALNWDAKNEGFVGGMP